MFHGLIELHKLRVWLRVHHGCACQINCLLRWTSSRNSILDLFFPYLLLKALFIKCLIIKCLIHQTKVLIMLNHLRYWPLTFLCLTILTKDFRYSSLVCAKFDLIASKLVPLDSWPNMMLIKLGFIATPKIKQLFWVIRLMFMIFHVLVVVPVALAK